TATLLADGVAADKAGWQLTIHAIGGNSNSVALDVFEKIAKANGPRERRWQIEHATGVRDADIHRFKELGVVASMQPYLFGGVFGADAIYYRRMFENALVVAFGSDAPMTEFNPMLGVYAAVLGGVGIGDSIDRGPITIEEAVRAYTAGSAYGEFTDGVKGTLSVGKYADFVILSDDIFELDIARIPDVEVVKTVVAGQVVYSIDQNNGQQ
ncbi:MAG: amidohydrolase family protein, partial [Blastocatellia bacterium]|nr:amidohydrolase family protein [Blastocatellia bacterium]